MFEQGQARLFKHKQARQMIKAGQATFVSIQKREKVLGIDLWQVLWQDLACSVHTLEHNTAQRQVGFFAQVNKQ
jgi:uncharacterized protein YuzE